MLPSLRLRCGPVAREDETMRIVETVDEARELTRAWKRAGETVGLVPTMGYLHEGHGSLIRRARDENDRVVVSVFVNPTQFGKDEDLSVYPRDLEGDAAFCESLGADALFHPDASEMYRDHRSYVNVEELADTLDGAARPGHFRGVCTVVAKLFNIVAPDRAYFGRKDAQQLAVVEKMAADLNFDVEVVGCPTVREEDGLAMSSRNSYLDASEREAATVLSRAVERGRAIVREGMASSELEGAMKATIAEEPLAQVEYVSVVDARTMQPLERVRAPVTVAVAARVGRTRLIDNFSWPEEA